MIKPSTVKGCRNFYGEELFQRDFLFKTIREAFKKMGFSPLETPAMETSEVLLGKYGEEGDKLLFKILNSGDYFSKISDEDLHQKNSKKISNSITSKGLRYDLTVPMARFISQNQNDLTFPFKRYQIQPVWRAERPQKGRYREFYQCDGDIVGSSSLLCEVELLSVFDQVFKSLKLDDFSIYLNNRKILAGIAEVIDESERFSDLTCALDKLDKIGPDKVLLELKERGIKESSIEKIRPYIEKDVLTLDDLKSFLASSSLGIEGMTEIETLLKYSQVLGITSLKFSPLLARGLDYYTGPIFEVKLSNSNIGSVASGGRYDHLTEIFGVKNLSGVGISFGADRLFDVLKERNLFPKNLEEKTRVLFINFGDDKISRPLELAQKLREQNIIAEIYPSSVKLKKQFKYADDKNISFVAILGDEEESKGTIQMKNLETGSQDEISQKDLINYFR